MNNNNDNNDNNDNNNKSENKIDLTKSINITKQTKIRNVLEDRLILKTRMIKIKFTEMLNYVLEDECKRNKIDWFANLESFETDLNQFIDAYNIGDEQYEDEQEDEQEHNNEYENGIEISDTTNIKKRKR